MAELSNQDVETRLWREVEKHQFGMLGVLGDAHHFQPMTAFVERDASRIWFFTYKDTDLAHAAERGGDGAFIVQTGELYACIDGAITLDHDRERMDRYWNASVAAWYPEGKDDPRLTMVRLDCTDAAVWLMEAGPVKYAFEVARANMRKTTPDVSERRDIDFH